MNTETKRHIDAARQVLVGVVPNPTLQIDQITYALIYKFMDDMDQAAIKNGDEPAFFIGDLEQYSWARIMDSRIGNQDRMNLYVVAFQKFAEAKQLPELFRNILKSAFLPYRSPETLGLFLKEIDYFDYSHPEELGNAYEYLLSIIAVLILLSLSFFKISDNIFWSESLAIAKSLFRKNESFFTA